MRRTATEKITKGGKGTPPMVSPVFHRFNRSGLLSIPRESGPGTRAG